MQARTTGASRTARTASSSRRSRVQSLTLAAAAGWATRTVDLDGALSLVRVCSSSSPSPSLVSTFLTRPSACRLLRAVTSSHPRASAYPTAPPPRPRYVNEPAAPQQATSARSGTKQGGPSVGGSTVRKQGIKLRPVSELRASTFLVVSLSLRCCLRKDPDLAAPRSQPTLFARCGGSASSMPSRASASTRCVSPSITCASTTRL